MYVRWISVLSLLEGLLDGLRVRDLALAAAGLVGLLGLLVWQSYRQGRRRVHSSAAPALNLPATLRAERRSSLSTLVSLACGISDGDVQSRQQCLATGSHSAKLEFDLRLLVEHGTRPLASQAESKGLRFTTAVAANVPQRVRGDAAGMAVAFTNLLDNAVKFTSEGAVRLEVAVTRDAHCPPNLRFVVYDTGSGIDAKCWGACWSREVRRMATASRSQGSWYRGWAERWERKASLAAARHFGFQFQWSWSFGRAQRVRSGIRHQMRIPHALVVARFCPELHGPASAFSS